MCGRSRRFLLYTPGPRAPWVALGGRFALVLALLTIAVDVRAARPTYRGDPEYIIDTWETDDGLPENSATAMVQTADGYLWFGTFNGLVRFDGVKFAVFDPSNTPALPAPGVANLHLDRTGRLWVSTLRGMAVRSNDQWRAISAADGWPGDLVRTFAERGNGDLLVTTFDGGVLEFADGKFRALPPPPGETGKGYFGLADKAGKWWVAQHGFTGHWDGARWVRAIAPEGSPAGRFGFAPARDGGLWMLAGANLCKYAGVREVVRHTLPELNGGVWSLSEDGDGNVWICTYDRGLYRVAPGGQLRHWTTANGLSYEGTRFVFEDRERNLWVGTSGGGLMRFRPREIQAFAGESGLTERVVNSVSADANGSVWIGSYGKGLFRLDGGRVTPVPLADAAGRVVYVQSVLADRGGRVWVGSFGQGFWRVEPGGARRVGGAALNGENILALFEDSRGRVWIGGGQGVWVYEEGEFHTRADADGRRIRAVCNFAEDDRGDIWMTNGEAVFRLRGGRIDAVTAPDNQSIRHVVCLKPEAGGVMWMGSRDAGLLRWRDGRLARVDAVAGLPAKAVYAIQQDDEGYFWMTSNRGVIRALRRDLDAVADAGGDAPPLRCRVFDTADGLPGIDGASGRQPVTSRDASGRLWLATPKGVAAVDPARLRASPPPPATHVEELAFEQDPDPTSTDGARERRSRVLPPFGGRVVLPPGSRHVEFRYTGLSLAAPDKVRFQVLVEGRDAYWQDVGNERVAHYHSPPPGDYVFKVRAAGPDGTWDAAGAAVAFSVRPFFWQTTWFRVGLTAALAAAGAAGVLWMVQARHRRATDAVRRVRDQSAALVKLARSEAVAGGDVGRAFAEITETAARVLGVGEVGVWLLDEAGGELRCADFYDAARGVHREVGPLRASDYPGYLENLRGGRVIDAADAARDPRTGEFARTYPSDGGAVSALHAAVRVSGGLVGVVRHEQAGAPRIWRGDEIAFAAAVADQVAQALSNAQRERATRELRDSEERMSLAAQAASVGMWSWDFASGRSWMTDKCREIFALPPGGDVGHDAVLRRIHPDDRSAVDEALREANAGGRAFEAECRLLLPDGGLRWIFARGLVETDPCGTLVRVRGAAVDISRRKQAEERFRLVVEAAPNGMIMVDSQGRMAMVNAEVERVFGYSRHDLVGRPLKMLFPERHAGPGAKGLDDPSGAAADREGMLNGHEPSVRRADGRSVPVEIGANPMDTTEGKFVLFSITDVSERKRAESQAAQLRNELAHLARVTMLGELSGSLAHELNQPLTSILSNAQAAQRFLARDDPDFREVAEILQDIVSEDKRAGEVIRRLRALFKKGEVQRQSLDVNEVLQDVLKLARSDLINHGVAVDVRLAPGLPPVTGDRVQLQQVLLNLIKNGCDAMERAERGDRRLDVSTARAAADDADVRVSIRDRGCGVPPESVGRIFEPFYTTKSAGMGLGLAVCRTIIQGHGGRLWLENNPDRGATVHLELATARDEPAISPQVEWVAARPAVGTLD